MKARNQSMPYFSFQNKPKRCTNLQLILYTRRFVFFFFTPLNENVTPKEAALLPTCTKEPHCHSLQSAEAPGDCVHTKTADTSRVVVSKMSAETECTNEDY